MIPRTDVSVSAKGKRVTGTAGTSNHTTNRRAAVEPAATVPRNLATATGVQSTATERPDKMRVKDMPPKTVAVLGAVCLTTGWLLASMLAPPVAKLQTLPERRSSRPAATAVEPTAAFAEQLHWRLQQAPVAPVPRRNPFTFGGKTRSAAGVAGQPAAAAVPAGGAAPVLEVAPVPSGPIFSLAGIGSTSSADGVLLTAVLSDGNTVHLVNAGQTIAGYKIVTVTEDSVTLADAAGQQTILRLR